MQRIVLWTMLVSGLAGGNLAQAAPSVLAPDVLATPIPSMRAATNVEAQAFRKLYAKADAATSRRDMAFLRNMTTDDYTFVYRSGLGLDKTQLINVTAQIFRRVLKFNGLRTRLERIGTVRNLAVVVSTSTVDMTYRGLDNKTHRSVSTSQVMDTWILLRQGWRMQSSQEIATRSTVDGRVYPPLPQTTTPQKTLQPAASPQATPKA